MAALTARRIDLPGAWPDVAGDVLAYAADTVVAVLRLHAGGELETCWTRPLELPLRELRVAVAPDGTAAVVGKTGDVGARQGGDLVYVEARGATPLGPAFGDNPCAIAHDGAGFVVTLCKAGSPPTLERVHLADGRCEALGTVLRAPDGQYSSQGILDLGVDGSVIWLDLRRAIAVGSWTLTKPNVRNGIIVGQTDPPAIRVAVGDRVFTMLEAHDGMAENPHLALGPDGRILVCAYTARGASFAFVDPPYPPGEQPPVIVGPPAPPPAPPQPPPAPPRPSPRSSPFPVATRPQGAHMRVFLKQHGKYVGIDPEPVTGRQGDAAFPVYADREKGQAWEEVELTAAGDGLFLARFLAADRMLSIQPDGALESRCGGTDGAYELVRATRQPEGVCLLYRADDDAVLGVPLTIEEA